MDKKTLELVVCPVCKGALEYAKEDSELICQFDKLAFPIKNDIPVMLVDAARTIKQEG